MFVWQLRDHYELLEIPRDADSAAVRSAYRRQMKAWHPDHHSASDHEEVAFRTEAIGEAYAVLSSVRERRRYDRTLPSEHVDAPDFDVPEQRLAENWFHLAAWMKDEDVGTPFERKIAYTAGSYIERGRSLSDKQRPWALRAWAEASDQGWDPQDV